MREWVRRDHRQIACVCLRERRVRGIRKIEVRASVIDQIDALSVMAQRNGICFEVARVDDQ